jgi:HK97 family phage portal protein
MRNPLKWIVDQFTPTQPGSVAMTRGWLHPGDISVTLYTALRWSTFWALGSRIGKIVATLPLRVLEVQGQKKVLAEQQTKWASWLWDISPNDVWNGPKFVEAAITTASILGNCYLLVTRNGVGQPMKLEWLNPSTMTPQYLDSGRGPFAYVYTDAGGITYNYSPRDIIHIAGPGMSLIGDSLIEVGAQTIAESKAISDYALGWYQSSGNIGGVVTMPGTLTEPKRKIYEDVFNNTWGGAGKAGQTLVLEKGMTFTPIGGKISESNVSSLREDILLDVARLLDLPISLIQYKAGAQGYGSNIQALIDGFVKFSLGRWVAVIEAELTKKFFTLGRGPLYVVELSTDELQRGNLESLARALPPLIACGALTRNEARVQAGWNTVDEEGMDDYTVTTGITPPPPIAPGEPGTNEESVDEEQTPNVESQDVDPGN